MAGGGDPRSPSPPAPALRRPCRGRARRSMKAAVPYMAALTGAPRAGAALQPPRQLFGGAARVDKRWSSRARERRRPRKRLRARRDRSGVPAVPAGTAESQFAAIEALATGSPGALSAKLATKPATRPPTQPTGASERPAVPSHSAEPTSDTGSPPASRTRANLPARRARRPSECRCRSRIRSGTSRSLFPLERRHPPLHAPAETDEP